MQELKNSGSEFFSGYGWVFVINVIIDYGWVKVFEAVLTVCGLNGVRLRLLFDFVLMINTQVLGGTRDNPP